MSNARESARSEILDSVLFLDQLWKFLYREIGELPNRHLLTAPLLLHFNQQFPHFLREGRMLTDDAFRLLEAKGWVVVNVDTLLFQNPGELVVSTVVADECPLPAALVPAAEIYCLGRPDESTGRLDELSGLPRPVCVF